jgi:hypothetical protein
VPHSAKYRQYLMNRNNVIDKFYCTVPMQRCVLETRLGMIHLGCVKLKITFTIVMYFLDIERWFQQTLCALNNNKLHSLQAHPFHPNCLLIITVSLSLFVILSSIRPTETCYRYKREFFHHFRVFLNISFYLVYILQPFQNHPVNKFFPIPSKFFL